jgi:hypothetical protein
VRVGPASSKLRPLPSVTRQVKRDQAGMKIGELSASQAADTPAATPNHGSQA